MVKIDEKEHKDKESLARAVEESLDEVAFKLQERELEFLERSDNALWTRDREYLRGIGEGYARAIQLMNGVLDTNYSSCILTLRRYFRKAPHERPAKD